MAAIKVRDLAYGRLQSPDLDAQEEFLTAFGMVRAARTPTALYMRGTDPTHHIHVTDVADRLRRLRGRCIGPAEVYSQRCSVSIAGERLRGSAVASIEQFLERGDLGCLSFGRYAWREAAQLGETRDGRWPILLGEVTDFEDDLWPTIRIATHAFDERPTRTAAASAG